MTDHCLTCGGLRLEPNKTYGYAGKICQCYRPQGFMKKASEERIEVKPPFWVDQLWHLKKEITELKTQIQNLLSASESDLLRIAELREENAALRRRLGKGD